MSDEPKQEATESSKDETKLSMTKSLKLQPSAEFVAERESETGPQISLPSSPAAATDPTPAPAPEKPKVPDPVYTPAPDPLAQQMQAQAAPVETPEPDTPPAQPIVPQAFQAPEQAAASAKAQSQSHAQAQQFALTSEAALTENEAQASAALFSGLTLALGLLASLSYIVVFYLSKNGWAANIVTAVLAAAAIACSFKSYGVRQALNPVTVIGLVGAILGLLFVANILLAEWALQSLFSGYGF